MGLFGEGYQTIEEKVLHWFLIFYLMVRKILLKLLFSLFLVFLLRLVFPSIVKGIKVMVIILLIAILFFNIVLNNNII